MIRTAGAAATVAARSLTPTSRAMPTTTGVPPGRSGSRMRVGAASKSM
ncbi:hypothetical protein GPZ77_32250 [Streptomyces sp. QHH-9511]|nr:hypothetical protein [Streptomyces sp. QHH-9511]QGZ52385.1 hypothetical protein GPZ77_32250 [Streptomyces sp. QHH-9511]